MPARVRRHFVDVPQGTIHYAEAGEGDPVLLLHQTPRSWNEYRDVLPLLAASHRAIAMDTIGFGDSTSLPRGEDSIERWSEVVRAFLDALGLARVDLVGHHTGATIAIETAGVAPERVRSVVLSSCPFDDRASRAEEAGGKAVVDDVDRSPDGSHVAELWRIRQAFYPDGDVDLLERFLVDAIKAGPLAAEGHRVVARYDVQRRIDRVTCPALLIGATADPYAYPTLPALQAALPHAETAVIEGGMVPLPDQMPREFADAVAVFFARRP